VLLLIRFRTRTITRTLNLPTTKESTFSEAMKHSGDLILRRREAPSRRMATGVGPSFETPAAPAPQDEVAKVVHTLVM
jgi:hypothetical protein